MRNGTLKCIKIQVGERVIVRRVLDVVAEIAVKNGWHLVPKHVWKRAGRPKSEG